MEINEEINAIANKERNEECVTGTSILLRLCKPWFRFHRMMLLIHGLTGSKHLFNHSKTDYFSQDVWRLGQRIFQRNKFQKMSIGTRRSVTRIPSKISNGRFFVFLFQNHKCPLELLICDPIWQNPPSDTFAGAPFVFKIMVKLRSRSRETDL